MQSLWDADRLSFSGPIDAHRFPCGPSQEEALARLHFLVDHGCQAGLVLGGSGRGKTWLLDAFRRALAGTHTDVVAVRLGEIETHEFFWQVATQLATGAPPRHSVGGLWRQVSDHLAENRWLGRATVFLLDDATSATADLLDHVQRLVELDPAGTARMTTVLACDPRRLERLGPHLVGLCALRIDLTP